MNVECRMTNDEPWGPFAGLALSSLGVGLAKFGAFLLESVRISAGGTALGDAGVSH
jgi:hypothetical protein